MSGIEIPILETERLRLRPHRAGDLQPCSAMWADPIVIRHTTGKPLTREEVWTKILRYRGLWVLLGFGYWIVEEKATGHFVGEVGFADFKRNVEPSLEGIPEAGWILASHAHGKGYATEAVHAAIAWGEQHFAGMRTVCLIHPENTASIRAAEKCGYREYVRALYKGHAVIMFERQASR